MQNTEKAQISKAKHTNSTVWIYFANSPRTKMAVIDSQVQNIPASTSNELTYKIKLLLLLLIDTIKSSFSVILWNITATIQQNSIWKLIGIILMRKTKAEFVSSFSPQGCFSKFPDLLENCIGLVFHFSNLKVLRFTILNRTSYVGGLRSQVLIRLGMLNSKYACSLSIWLQWWIKSQQFAFDLLLNLP